MDKVEQYLLSAGIAYVKFNNKKVAGYNVSNASEEEIQNILVVGKEEKFQISMQNGV